MTAKKNYTIKDIAELTNLSRGTIDKVLHNRGGVSKSTIAKVQQVLEQVSYTPNLIAKSLKQHKRYSVAVLLPVHQGTGYWQRCYEGIRKARVEYVSFGGDIRFYYYDRSIADYKLKLSAIVTDQCDAVLIAPIDFPEVRESYGLLTAAGIPFIFINAPVADTGYAGFIGQDYITSGRVAAQMMDFLTPDKGPLLILHQIEVLELSGHLAQKENGFIAYFKEHQPERSIQVLTIYDHAGRQPMSININEFSGVFLTTSKAFDYLVQMNRCRSVRVVGYDLIPENIIRLQDGDIDVVLHQNPEMQGYLGLNTLLDNLLFKSDIPLKKLLPIEIVTRENLGSYLNK